MSNTLPRATGTPLLATLLALGLGILTVLVATGTQGRVTAPWWVLAAVLSLLMPRGSWGASSPRSRLLATGALVLAAALFVGGVAMSSSAVVVLAVLAPLWFAVAAMVAPLMRGHRALSIALFGSPIALAAAAGPLALTARVEFVDVSVGLTAILAAASPVLLLGGAAMLTGSVVDLLLRMRRPLTPGAVRGVTFVFSAITLVLIGVAGAVAVESVPGPGGRIETVGIGVSILGVLALGHGLRTLARSEVGLAGAVMTVLAAAAVVLGALRLPAEPLASALGLVLLIALAGMLGSVAGLTGAAALLRSRPHLPARIVAPRPVRLEALTHRVTSTVAHLRARYVTH